MPRGRKKATPKKASGKSGALANANPLQLEKVVGTPAEVEASEGAANTPQAKKTTPAPIADGTTPQAEKSAGAAVEKEAVDASAEKFSDEFAASDEWASLLLSSQDGDDEEEAVFSKFHAHFAGRRLLSTRELVVQAKAELELTKGWSEREAGLCHEKLLDALPAMSLAIKEKALRRRNFSPAIALKMYCKILSTFIKRNKRSALVVSRPTKRVRFEGHPDSDEGSRQRSKSKSKRKKKKKGRKLPFLTIGIWGVSGT